MLAHQLGAPRSVRDSALRGSCRTSRWCIAGCFPSRSAAPSLLRPCRSRQRSAGRVEVQVHHHVRARAWLSQTRSTSATKSVSTTDATAPTYEPDFRMLARPNPSSRLTAAARGPCDSIARTGISSSESAPTGLAFSLSLSLSLSRSPCSFERIWSNRWCFVRTEVLFSFVAAVASANNERSDWTCELNSRRPMLYLTLSVLAGMLPISLPAVVHTTSASCASLYS
jgi:hypothetical protein